MAASLEDAEPTKERRGGFIAGFALTAGLCLIAIALYARHEAIATAAPQTADALARYVAFVDMARERLADLIAMARDRLAAKL